MKRLINQHPSRVLAALLGLLPFALLLLLYLWGSGQRLAENPDDKLLPAFSQMGETLLRAASEPNVRTGERVLWTDTAASLQRLGLGVGLAALAGLLFGLTQGLFPLLRASLSPLVTALSLIPPMAVLPVLFILLGLGEAAKVGLILIGISPFLIRDLQQRVQELPQEQLIKAQTLGASSWQILLRVVMPQVLPRLLDALRLALGPAWLFLIAAEAIAATDGLGYRIFLVRRYLAMDLILPYVAWITLLAWLTDLGLKRLSLWAFPWYHQRR